jgi:hypothetical protein
MEPERMEVRSKVFGRGPPLIGFIRLSRHPNIGHNQIASACLKSADIVAKVFLGGRTKFFRAADAFYERRGEAISFHPKSTRDLRSGVEKQHSGGEVQRSTFARFSGSLDFRLLQQYLPCADIRQSKKGGSC